ncbi:MAG: 4-hydroxyphenylpyruvate dioxygenase, partial [Alphaproteobacteria bacterium]
MSITAPKRSVGATRPLWENPLGTDGFEFVEYASPDPEALRDLFTRMGFTPIARHRSKNVTLFRQGGINFILNEEPNSFASEFAHAHGPSACAMAIRVTDARKAYQLVAERGATLIENHVGPMELNIPTIEGIGGIRFYMVDRYGSGASIYDVDFVLFDDVDPNPRGHGLTYVDHLTHNVNIGNMDKWSEFYERIFNFKEIRYFDIEGKLTGLRSRAMTSPCGKIRIPINESADDKSQIAEYLKRYRGEGIQHIALGTDDIYDTVERMRERSIAFLDTPDTYYEAVDTRLPGHDEDLGRMQALGILIDGAPTEGQGLLLQIFTETVIGPIFFEIIQRKGNEGFG